MWRRYTAAMKSSLSPALAATLLLVLSACDRGAAYDPLAAAKAQGNALRNPYAVVPPQAARNPEFYHKMNIPVPTLRVVREEDDGVVISGMKMLATGALYANEIWIGNVIPLAPDQSKEAITCAIPCNAPGLALWSQATGLSAGMPGAVPPVRTRAVRGVMSPAEALRKMLEGTGLRAVARR